MQKDQISLTLNPHTSVITLIHTLFIFFHVVFLFFPGHFFCNIIFQTRWNKTSGHHACARRWLNWGPATCAWQTNYAIRAVLTRLYSRLAPETSKIRWLVTRNVDVGNSKSYRTCVWAQYSWSIQHYCTLKMMLNIRNIYIYGYI